MSENTFHKWLGWKDLRFNLSIGVHWGYHGFFGLQWDEWKRKVLWSRWSGGSWTLLWIITYEPDSYIE